MLKKIIFPAAVMVVGVIGSVFEFVQAINDKSLEEKISEEVSKQLNKNEEGAE